MLASERKKVLEDTIRQSVQHGTGYHNEAKYFLAKKVVPKPLTGKQFSLGHDSIVYEGDWGDVAGYLTAKHNARYTILNMANQHQPGGGYFDGCAAQEENMWRRTDCHLLYAKSVNHPNIFKKVPSYTTPLGARAVCEKIPRVCFKESEANNYAQRSRPFEFFELRSAAVDTRNIPLAKLNKKKYENDMILRIHHQFLTAHLAGATHLLLSAFGCGAFANPEYQDFITETVFKLYRDAVDTFGVWFTRIDFAIFSAGYGNDNFSKWSRLNKKCLG